MGQKTTDSSIVLRSEDNSKDGSIYTHTHKVHIQCIFVFSIFWSTAVAAPCDYLLLITPPPEHIPGNSPVHPGSCRCSIHFCISVAHCCRREESRRAIGQSIHSFVRLKNKVRSSNPLQTDRSVLHPSITSYRL